MSPLKKAILGGLLGSLILTIFYLIIMFLSMPTPLAIWQNFKSLWYLIIFLLISFGVQVGCWLFLRTHHQANHQGTIPAVSGTTSGLTMVACCAHHLADLLPILGLSGTAIFLAQYQKPFLILGVAINLLGIVYMLNLYKRSVVVG